MSSVDPIPVQLLKNGERAMTICNSCRHCEGFCAVFPAMERLLKFSPKDLKYLANLCHDCRECYYSCQYAPPHEFGLNLPKVLSEIRRETYRTSAWPVFFVNILGRVGRSPILSLLLIPILFLLVTMIFQEPAVLFMAHSVEEGSFYRVISHGTMVASFSFVGLFVLVALIMGFLNFSREISQGNGSRFSFSSLKRAILDSLSLRYLKGGSDGCSTAEEEASSKRRWYHHMTFYGFLLCFLSTTTAAIYHNMFNWEAPYEFLSIPVILGSIGGVGLLIGPLGLFYLKKIRDPEPTDPLQSQMDVAFLVMLFLTSLTGLLLLLLRETAVMGIALIVHLGIVMGLFLTLPYGKFVHGIYRFASLIRFAKEEQE